MAQTIILFEDILKGDVLLESKEIQALSNHQLGGCDLSRGSTDKMEEFHDWLNDELQKAISGGYCQTYRMKAPFDNIKGDNDSGEYSAPVNVFLFEPDAAIDDGILLLTCSWKGDIFRNDHYVCGIVADEDDIARMLGKVDGHFIGSKEEKPTKKEPSPEPGKMTTKEVISYLNELTKKAEAARSFSELEKYDDEERDFWNALDEKIKNMKTVLAAKKKYNDKSLIMSIVIANR